MRIAFSISRKVLSFATPAYSVSMRATSGRDGCMNNPSVSCMVTANQGPIPVGFYYIDPKELSDPILAGDVIRRAQGDWGDWRIRLHPAAGTNTFGRDGFFIHGGGMDGSAGCIDIGGGVLGNRQTDKLLAAIKGSPITIAVEVTG
ncbi:MAG: DUF2778 domain-containing protein [Gammaproteobacteria bacterium]|nr:DUF2778 domain-containing protein [Gammaproteobacteria bacterium]